jgi:hypothetical protein
MKMYGGNGVSLKLPCTNGCRVDVLKISIPGERLRYCDGKIKIALQGW